jgi:hypothetical protein
MKIRRSLKKFGGMLIEIVKKIRFKMKLREMDRQWYFTFGNCFSLFPPSFYYTHTQEEIDRITAEEIAKIRKLLDEDD